MDVAAKPLHKPFARPVATRIVDTQPCGDDIAACAVVSLRPAYGRPAFKKADALIAGKIETPKQYGVLLCHLDTVHTGLRGSVPFTGEGLVGWVRYSQVHCPVCFELLPSRCEGRRFVEFMLSIGRAYFQ